MRIALVEARIEWEEKEKNLAKLKRQLEKLKETDRGIDMILLPEMSFTGFSMNIDRTAENGYTVETIKALSDEYGVAIGFGWTEVFLDEEGKRKGRNHYSISYDRGNKLYDYVKIHPFSYSDEDKYFVGGNDILVEEIGDFSFGTAICYDLRFPEIFQAMSRYAQAIIVPANWPKKRQKHFEALVTARAIENQCYILAINCKGKIGKEEYSGGTTVINPLGDIVEPVNVVVFEQDEIKIYDIKNDVNHVRESFPIYKDRKTNLYKKLL